MADIIGRSDELDQLERFIRSTPPAPVAIVLEGDAGIGKSTLWSAAAELADAHGLRVLRSRPTEAERGLAFTGLGDLFEDLVDDVLSMLTAPRRRALEAALLLGEPSDHVDPRALGVATRDALEHLGGEADTIVAIDDVQWLDAASTRALSFALRRLEAPIRLLVALRVAGDSSGDIGADTTDLLRALPSSERLTIGPLSLGAIQAVLHARLDRTFARPVLRRIHAMSDGNPFYALEIARSLGDEVAPSEPLPIPKRLDDLTARRLALLPDATKAALGLIAAAGEVSLDLLRRCEIDHDTLRAAAETQVIDTGRDRVRFTHPLLASAAYARLSDAERRSIHATLAPIVSDPVDRARHVALAADHADHEIAAMLDRAADAAYDRAAIKASAELRDHALRLTPTDRDDDVHRRTIALARAELADARPARAKQLLDELLARTPSGPRRAEALVASIPTTDRSTEIDMRREALAHADGDAKLQAELHSDLAWELWIDDCDVDAAMHHALAAVAEAERLDDPRLLAITLSTLAFNRVNGGEPDAVAIADRCYWLAVELDGLARAEVAPFLMGTMLWTGRHERIRTLLEPLAAEWSERDELVACHAVWGLAWVDLFAADFHAAAEHAATAREIDEQYGATQGAASLLPESTIAAHRGDLDAARQIAIEGLQCNDGELRWVIPMFEGVLGLVDAWNADPESACAHFAAAERTNFNKEPGLMRWRSDYVEALLKLDRIDDANDLLDAWDSDATRVDRRAALADIRRCRGLVADALGDRERALSLLAQAAAEHAAVDDHFGRARDLLALGIVRRRAKQKRASREAIEESIALFEQCGADGWTQRARSEVGTLGGRRREEGLTPAEQRTADLAADGHTNHEIAAALFISERTVETHLSHTYAKLGIRSRTELARALDRER